MDACTNVRECSMAVFLLPDNLILCYISMGGKYAYAKLRTSFCVLRSAFPCSSAARLLPVYIYAFCTRRNLWLKIANWLRWMFSIKWILIIRSTWDVPVSWCCWFFQNKDMIAQVMQNKHSTKKCYMINNNNSKIARNRQLQRLSIVHSHCSISVYCVCECISLRFVSAQYAQYAQNWINILDRPKPLEPHLFVVSHTHIFFMVNAFSK